MPRLMLSDSHRPKLREILLPEAIYNKRDLHMTVEDYWAVASRFDKFKRNYESVVAKA